MNIQSVKETDVLVVGGGTTGVAAAVTAAKQGLKVILIEELNSLGGTQTNAMVTPMMDSYIRAFFAHPSISYDIAESYHDIAQTLFPELTFTHFDPLTLKMAMVSLCAKHGVQIEFQTRFLDLLMKDDRIDGVICTTKSDIRLYRANVVIDCSGDAVVAKKTGEAKLLVNPFTGKNQAISLRFEMDGVDLKQLSAFLVAGGQTREFAYPRIHCDGYGFCPKVRELLMEAIASGELTRLDVSHFQFFSIPGRPDALAFNCPELGSGEDVTDADFLNQKIVEGNIAVSRIAAFMRKQIAGCETAAISQIAPLLGIRQTNQLDAIYVLSIEDVFAFRKFEDGIAKTNYPVDVHGGKGKLVKRYDESVAPELRYYEIPFRSIVPKVTKNLFVAGRSSGFDFFAQSSARIQYTCRAMGEAAALGAAEAIKTNKTVREVDGVKIRQIMDAHFNEAVASWNARFPAMK
jgi:ribulose 1,5-bisphosphate synthetase/thiazole synthase